MITLESITLEPKHHAIPTLKDCVSFVRENGLCSKWTDLQIVQSINNSIVQQAFAYMTNAENNINAIVWGSFHYNARHEICLLHIVGIAGFKGCLKLFLKHLKQKFPEVKTLTSNRSGRFVTYNKL